MKFLLFFISIVFSLIFFIFHSLSEWKDIFWDKISNSVDLISFSNNLLIESFVFFIIGVFFIFIFSNFKTEKETNIWLYKYEIMYFVFYILFTYLLYFINFNIDYILLISIILFIISDILFNYISNISSFIKNKSSIRVIWLLFNYLSTIASIYYILNNEYYLISILILSFNIIFNLLIHKKYTNYISLLISILTIGFLFYILYFWLFELYILYI